ncbi:hypothetical protein OVA21_04150 [Dietzia sp. SL131]|uniref:hypothetical protein n=1 Tax=Dietzia sp. SL131 TaxID=2995149 RepID=UPI00227AEA66|nr:hypothetical protein [Dietzia sp. SL131]MCY1656414.1 hypothetical protein [Dietzia sp. SL131]
MNAPRTLRELLEEASGYGELSTRQLEAKVHSAVEKGDLRGKLNRATIAQILNGSYRKRPTDDTIRAIAYLAGVNDEVAFTAAGRRTPGRPFAEDLPDGVDDLTPKEREAAVYMLRVLVQQRRELNQNEDQDTQDPQGDPKADGEAGTRGAPMKPVFYLEDRRAPDVDDMLDRVTAEARRQEEGEQESEEPLPFDPTAVHAARDVDGPSQGELRRRPGKNAGEENQEPGDDWEGA